MFSSSLAAPSLQPVPGKAQRGGRASASLKRCLVPGLQAPGSGLFGDGWFFARAQSLFSKSFTWPLVLPAVHVVSPSEPRAACEANTSLCHTLGTVLARVCLLSVHLRGDLRFYHELVRPRHCQGSADTYAAEDAVSVLSLGTAYPERFHLAGGTGGYRTARVLPDGVSLNFSQHMETGGHG